MKLPAKFKKAIFGFLICFFFLLVYLYYVLFIPGEPDFEDPIHSIIHKDTAVYLQLNHWFDQMERFGASPFWTTIKNKAKEFKISEDLEGQLTNVLQITQEIESQIRLIPMLGGFQFGQIFNQEIVIAAQVESVKIRQKVMTKNPEILWVSKLKTPEKRLLNMALWGLPKANYFTSFPDFAYKLLDNEIHHFTLKRIIHVQKPGLEKGLYSFQDFYVRRFFNLLLISNNKKYLEKSLALITSPSDSKSIGNTFAFKEAKKVIGEHENFAYINNNKHFQNFYNLEKNLSPRGLKFPFQEFYGLLKQFYEYNALSSISGYWDPESLMRESRFNIKLSMGINYNNANIYHRSLYTQEEKPFEILEIIPEDCAFLRAYRTDMVEEWAYLKKSPFFSSYFLKQVEQIIRGGDQEYSSQGHRKYFQTKFLPRFGQEYALFSSYKHFPKDEIKPSTPLPYLALVFEFPHLEMRKDLIQFFVRGIELNNLGEMEKKEVGGTEVYIFPRISSLVEGLNQPCMGFIDRYFVITTHIDYFEKLKSIKAGFSPSLKNLEDFKTMGGLKSQNLALYLNIDRIRDILVPMLDFEAENHATQFLAANRKKILKLNPDLPEPEIDKLVEAQYHQDILNHKKEGKLILDSFRFLNKISASFLAKGRQLIFDFDLYLTPEKK